MRRKAKGLRAATFAVLASVLMVMGQAAAVAGEQPDVAAEITDLTERAEGGEASAQFLLGMYYRYSLPEQTDGPADFEKAFAWFAKATDQGHPLAAHQLGTMHERGQGTVENLNKAISLYDVAAKAGYGRAMVDLSAALYHAGYYTEAFQWARKAAEAGEPAGYNNLAGFYHMGIGVERDFGKAAENMRIAAEYGDCVARMNLGGLYYNGDGVPQDGIEAARWFDAARKCAIEADDEDTPGIVEKSDFFLSRIDAGSFPPLLLTEREGPNRLDEEEIGAALLALLALDIENALSGNGVAPGSGGGGTGPCKTMWNFSCDAGTDTVLAGAALGVW
jgi:TPR repeat protein